jgi:hypothetical protein
MSTFQIAKMSGAFSTRSVRSGICYSSALVVDELFYGGSAEGKDIPPPAIRVAPKRRTLILINRLSGPAHSGYWDTERQRSRSRDSICNPQIIQSELSQMFPVLTQELSSSDQKRAENWRTLKCSMENRL